MRVYGRLNGQWQVVTTDANGLNDAVNLTWLCQWLKLNVNESPVYATSGIPQIPTIATQIYPDYYVGNAQRTFAPLFAALIISKVPNTSAPVYNIQCTTHSGAVVNIQEVPQ